MKVLPTHGTLWLVLASLAASQSTHPRARRQANRDEPVVIDVPAVAGGTPPPTAAPFTPAPPTTASNNDNINNGFLFGNLDFSFPDFFNIGNNGGGFLGGNVGGGGFGGNRPGVGGVGGFPGGGFGGGLGGGFGGNTGGGLGGGFGGNTGGGVDNGGGFGGRPGNFPPIPTRRPLFDGRDFFGDTFPTLPNPGNANPGLGGNPFPDFRPGGNNNKATTTPVIVNRPQLPPFNNQGGGNTFPDLPSFPTRPGFPTRPRPPFIGLPNTTPGGPTLTYSVCTQPELSPLGDAVSNDTIPQEIQGRITQELEFNPQLKAFLDLAANTNGAPSIIDNTESSDTSCPSQVSRATKFQRYGSSCWILQYPQPPIFFSVCKCGQCLAPPGYPQPPTSTCKPFLTLRAVFSYCENFTDYRGQPRITQELIALPVTCRCHHATSALTRGPEPSGAGVTTPATVTTPAADNDGIIGIAAIS